MGKEYFLEKVLGHSRDFVAYHVAQELAKLYPDKTIIEGETWAFDLEEYARAEKCAIVNEASFFPQTRTSWEGEGKKLKGEIENSWVDVLWHGHLIEVLLLTYTESCYRTRHHWIIADEQRIAEAFFQEVCDWNTQARGEVLVFESGAWVKNKELFESIKSATLDKLILRGPLKEQILADLDQFFASRELYERHGITWKRGVLFIGPPGNGKTHMVKALINHLQKPCLYVKSFDMEMVDSPHEGLTLVFQRARLSSPCIVVLEDLDAMINEKTRSFFLNELDGFAANTGIVVLATTNHPDKLDPAIRDRPSRFDRKYHFELPGPEERRVYIDLWSESLEAELRLSHRVRPALVGQTESFSFAYLKELCVSSMMQWITLSGAKSMDEVVLYQASLLREQMRSKTETTAS